MRVHFLRAFILAVWVATLALPAGRGVPACLAEDTAPLARKLESAIAERIPRVEEFRFIREEAEKLGVRAYLFGGTAAGYGHYVKWDLQREAGDARFHPDRFDYDYTNIYRSTQDLDIVIDGNREQAQALQATLAAKFPHLQGAKSAWEVRLLKDSIGDKEALLDNPDYLNQHTDSNSTGMIEITKPKGGDPVVRDLRDWNAKEPLFLKDVSDGKLHYYFSPLHASTSRAQQGMNPPILSVIRYLTKAFQYELEIRPEDLERIQKVIDEFDPDAPQSQYVGKWIEKNGKKLFQNAVNVEYAWDTLEKLGLRRKLIAMDPKGNEGDSLSSWLNREPLRSRPIGNAAGGKTAKELFAERGWPKDLIVAHETRTFLAYESITRAHTGEPNVFISRDSAKDETAAHGDGFYTRVGQEGGTGSGLTIRFHLNPDAILGKDFTLGFGYSLGHFIVVRNKNALRTIPESLQIGFTEYFEMLSRGELQSEGNRGILEKFKRRLGAKINQITPEQEAAVAQLVEREISRMSPAQKGFSPLLQEWFSYPFSSHYPKLVEMLIRNGNADEAVVQNILSQPYWGAHPEWVEHYLKKGNQVKGLIVHVLSQPHWGNHPEWVEAVRGLDDQDLIRYVLSQPQWRDHPEWVEALLKKGDRQLDFSVIQYILSQPHWANHPEWVEAFLKKGVYDHNLVTGVLSKPHAKAHPEWVDAVLEKGDADSAIASWILTQPHGMEHPEWAEKLIKRGKADMEFATYALPKPEWANHPELALALIRKGSGGVNSMIAQLVLGQPNWRNHPELIEALIKGGALDYLFKGGHVLGDPHWKNNPELRRLAGGAEPTLENLKAAFARGETLMKNDAKTCVEMFKGLR